MRGQPLEDSSGRRPIAVRDALERLRDGGFDRTLSRGVDPSPALREMQDRASSIAGVVGSRQ
jgi:hypothetical protein